MEDMSLAETLKTSINGELTNGNSTVAISRQRNWIKVIIVVCLLGVLLSGIANAGDIYLAVRTDGQTGSGSADDPFDAGTAPKYDSILARYQASTNFHYAAGTYETTGWFFQKRETANPNCRHFGAGLDRTTIRLVGAFTSTADGVIFGHDTGSVNGFEVHDLTLDCNATGNPIFANGLGAVGAINVVGNNLLFDHLKIEHFGTGKRGTECFPFFCYGHSGCQYSNIRLQNSQFTDPVTGNKDGLSAAVIGAPSNATIEGSIANCQFTNLRSDFIYSHAYSAPQCVGNEVTDCDTGFFLEPTDQQFGTWIIRDNQFSNVYEAVRVSWHPTGNLNVIRIENNVMTLTSDTQRAAAAFSIGDTGLAPGERRPAISEVTFLNNQVGATVQYEGDVAATYGVYLVAQSPLYMVADLVIQGNTMNVPPSEGFVITPLTVVQRWSGSGNFDSQQVPIAVMGPNGKPL